MTVVVDRDPPLVERGREDPTGLVEAHGVDPDAAGRGELFDSIVHAEILRVNTLNVQILLS